jgi:hypothetical protein
MGGVQRTALVDIRGRRRCPGGSEHWESWRTGTSYHEGSGPNRAHDMLGMPILLPAPLEEEPPQAEPPAQEAHQTPIHQAPTRAPRAGGQGPGPAGRGARVDGCSRILASIPVPPF